jgi:subtilisin family serine protease
MRLKRLVILVLFLLSLYLGFATKAIGQSDNSSPFNTVCQPNQASQGFTKPPSDTLFCLQWNFGVAHGINLWEAWTATKRRGENVKVALIDGGVHYEDGADFNPRLFLPGFDYEKDKITQDLKKDYDENFDDPGVEHGTNVLGIIGQETDNGKGTAGIAPGIEVIPYKLDLKKALDPEIADAIRRAVDQGADIINLSLDSPQADNDEIQRAAEYAYKHNVLIVAAAGNSDFNQKSLRYPIIRNVFDEELRSNSDGFSYKYRNGDFIRDENGKYVPKWEGGGDYVEDENGNYIKFKDGFYDSKGKFFDSNEIPTSIPPVRALITSARNEQGGYPKYSNPGLFNSLDPDHKYNYNGRVNITAPGGEFPSPNSCEAVDGKSIAKIKNYSGGIAQVDFQGNRGLVILFCQGTSQATPHVSGSAALVISDLKAAGYPTSNGRIDPDLVISIIEQSAHVSERKKEYENSPFTLGEHSVGHAHPLDAGIAVKLAQAVARAPQLPSASLTPEEAEDKVAKVITQKVKTLIKPLVLGSPFILNNSGATPSISDPSVANPPSPTPSTNAEADRSAENLRDKLFNILEGLPVILLLAYLLFSHFEGFLFLAGALASSFSGLWSLHQIHNNAFLSMVLLLSLPIATVLILVLVSTWLRKPRLRWLFAGTSFGAAICLLYSTFLQDVALLNDLSFLRFLVIPFAILIATPAWLSIKNPSGQPFHSSEDSKYERFAWGLSIGSAVLLICLAFFQEFGLLSLILLASALGVSLLGRSKHYKRLTLKEATGCAIILSCSATIAKLYSSSLDLYDPLPKVLLICIAVVYFIAWLSSQKQATVSCPNGHDLSLPSGKSGQVNCPKCGKSFEANTKRD